MAVPGTYQARLSVADWRETRSFQVLIDPRVAADGVTQDDLEAQLALNLRIRDALSDARKTAHRIEAVRKQLKERAAEVETGEISARAEHLLQQLAAFDAILVTKDGRYQQPMLVDQLSYLANMTGRADQRPGADAYVRLEELKQELSGCAAELKRLLETELAELNGLLTRHGAAPVNVP
jgi:hypothetical protein